MSLNHPYLGENYVPGYQLSASPFVTSSVISLGESREIIFPNVTRFFIVQNTGGTLAVSFTANGLKPANANYFLLSGTAELNTEIRTDRLFVSGVAGTSTFSLLAGLTPIPVKNFLLITASNGFSSVG